MNNNPLNDFFGLFNNNEEAEITKLLNQFEDAIKHFDEKTCREIIKLLDEKKYDTTKLIQYVEKVFAKVSL